MTEQLALEQTGSEALLPQNLNPLQLLSIALKDKAALDVIERLSALYERERDYQNEVSFDNALSRCQAKLTRISTDLTNKQTSSKYASYAKLDAAGDSGRNTDSHRGDRKEAVGVGIHAHGEHVVRPHA